jgi:hypothetical protein
MKLRLLGGEEAHDSFKKDMLQLLSLPNEKVSQFLNEVGKDRNSTNHAKIIEIGKTVFGLDETEIKRIAAIILYLVPRLYPERLTPEETVADLKQLELPEDKLRAFMTTFSTVPLKAKQEIRFGSLDAGSYENMPHWRNVRLSQNLKTIVEGGQVIGLVPTIHMTLLYGSLREDKTDSVTLEMSVDEAERLFTSLMEDYSECRKAIEWLKSISGDLIAIRPKE